MLDRENQTAYGIVDLIAHTLEVYFGDGISSLSDKFVYAIIKEAMENAEKVLKFPTNYEYRANILWASTMALNGSISYGRRTGDWGVHQLGHVLSYLFDTPHGATLSIVYPAWLKLHLSKLNNRIKELGKELFNANAAEETINKLEDFFSSIKSPVRLNQIGISENDKNKIVELMKKNNANGEVHKLKNENYKNLVNLMF